MLRANLNRAHVFHAKLFLGRRLCIIFVVCSDALLFAEAQILRFTVFTKVQVFKSESTQGVQNKKTKMKKLLQTLWSKDYLTDEHLTGFDNYKVSLTVALPSLTLEFIVFYSLVPVSVCVEWIFYPYLTHGALVILLLLLYIVIQLLDNLWLVTTLFHFSNFIDEFTTIDS